MATEAQKAARNLSQGMNMGGITSQPPAIKYLAAGFLVGMGGKYVFDVYFPHRPEPEVQRVKDKVTGVQAETIKRLQVRVRDAWACAPALDLRLVTVNIKPRPTCAACLQPTGAACVHRASAGVRSCTVAMQPQDLLLCCDAAQAMDSRMKTLEEKLGSIQAVMSRK